MPDTKSYTVLSPIDHNGKKYPIGSSIELEPEQAIALLKSKAVAGDVPVSKTAREIELEAIIADLRLDLETARKSIAELTAMIAEEQTKQPPKAKGKK